MPSPSVQRRRLVGLILVVLVYVAGLIGWTWAVVTVDSGASTGDRAVTQTVDGPSVSHADHTRTGHEVTIPGPNETGREPT